MKYKELIDFIENRMRMSHIYQPLLIRNLVDAGGSATVRQLATAFIAQDESQLRYYEKRIKEMPVRVLRRHDVVERDGDLVRLKVGNLTLSQKARIRMLCEQRMQAYVEKRGLSLWDYRLREASPVSDSTRYMVLKESGQRCALCGATKNLRPLDIDHIRPSSRGGTDDVWNLQVLCSKCNRSKGNRDDTDFRGEGASERDPECPFCSVEFQKSAIDKNETAFAVLDAYPVTKGHLLIIPKRHTADYFTMTRYERRDMEELVRLLGGKLRSEDPSIVGLNIGMNCGTSAGQTIPHAHMHLIPRREGDVKDPRGGVRGVIPCKQKY